MKTYDNYIHSENDLIGLIPSHWKLNQIKRTLHLLTDYDANGSFSDINQNVKRVDDIKDKYAWFVRTTDLEKYKPNFDLNEFIWVDEPTYNYLKKSKLFGGELLLAKRGDIGRVYLMPYTKYPASLAPNLYLARLDEKHIIPSYAYYFLLSEKGNVQLNLRNKSTTLGALYKDDFKSIEFLYPPLNEQTAIAQYLDTKTQAIDKKMNLLTKKADTYKELRKSIINDAVCKGLDKKVKLKEGEYVFPVNTNWKRYRLKDLGFLYSGLSGKAGDDFNQDDNPNNKGFIPFTNIANNTYLKANHLGTVILGENEKQNKVRKGDLFFLMSSEGYEDVGKTAALAEDIKDTYLNSFCKGYRITKRFCEPYFLNYLLLSDNYRKSLITEGKGFTRINLKMEKVTDFFVYLPPTKEEQTAIANYLDEKTQKIDAIVSNISKQIDTLKELRKTLINDVVTGKIKVVNN